MLCLPAHCPYRSCPSQQRASFRFRRKGHYARRCDGRRVPRYLCLHCRRSFSAQSFRLDYRLRRPQLWTQIFAGLVSKTTLRQAARLQRCSRKTLAARLALFGQHAQAFHRLQLERARSRGGLFGRFQLDELETFEHSRRLSPLSVPVLIERSSFFVLFTQVAALPPRGRLRPCDQRKKLLRQQTQGKRSSGSRAALTQAALFLRQHLDTHPCGVCLDTDRKPSYATVFARCLGPSLRHHRHDSKAPRVYGSPLFPINHTLALMRDGLSRLVRRSWAASKKASWLHWHLWVWIAWRNYVRPITNAAPHTTPAMALGLLHRQLSISQLLARRIFDFPTRS